MKLFTVFIILIFRIGSVIPVPYIDVAALKSASESGQTNEFFSYLSILTGGGLEYGAIFAMSVTPYINSSIIVQLLCVAIPALERLSKEGEEGQKKLAQITRYVTVFLFHIPKLFQRRVGRTVYAVDQSLLGGFIPHDIREDIIHRASRANEFNDCHIAFNSSLVSVRFTADT